MSLEKLNKFKSNPNSYYADSKPKTAPKPSAPAPAAPTSDPNSILTKESYLIGRILALEQEMFLLRTDLMTMVDYINKELDTMYTPGALRKKYSDYRASEQHVMRRIANKTEAIKNNELHFNDEPTESTKTDV